MDDTQVLRGHIRDLWRRTDLNDYRTHTEFLSLSEQNEAHKVLREEQVPMSPGRGGYAIWEGGHPETDRKVLIFAPSYETRNSILAEMEEGEGVIVCLLVEPLNGKFSDELTHRDYLGALMHLGIRRSQIGDILPFSSGAFIFAMRDTAQVICEELTRIKHTSVTTRIVSPEKCNTQMRREEIGGSVASLRVDSVIAMAFHLSRSAASQLIESERVFVNGQTITSSSYNLKKEDRISVRGHGKFEFLGAEGKTRKGRVFVKINMFK